MITDTDSDGLYDFEEINFDSDLIKINDGVLKLPTYAECIDEFGEGLFYVEGGVDWFLTSTYFPGAPSDVSSAYARDLLNQTLVLPIRSNPASKDSDEDLFDDGTEILIGTSPLNSDTDSDGVPDYFDSEPTIHNENVYNRKEAVKYAQYWGNNGYNPEFYDPRLIRNGGDYDGGFASDFRETFLNQSPSISPNCANFVSQCLYAGGIKMYGNWFMEKLDPNLELKGFFTWSISWANAALSVIDKNKIRTENDWVYTINWKSVERQYPYLKDNYSYGNSFRLYDDSFKSDMESAKKYVRPGDIVYFWQNIEGNDEVTHVAIVVEVTDDEIYYAGNTDPTIHSPISEPLSRGGYSCVEIILIDDVKICNYSVPGDDVWLN